MQTGIKNWRALCPELSDEARVIFEDLCCELTQRLGEAAGNDVLAVTLWERGASARSCLEPLDAERLEAAWLLVRDLSKRGWRLKACKGGVLAASPERMQIGSDAEMAYEKQRMREILLVARNRQLAESGTGDFVSGMERRRLHGASRSFVSIYSLMRDGRELAAALSARRGAPADALREVIDPYLQLATRGERCPETGFDLHDIWRYFRHTWSMAYKTAPARSMGLLVRDRAAPRHPVIGIAELRSAPIQISARDDWIGWSTDAFARHERLPRRAHKWPLSDEIARWLIRMVDEGIDEIFVDDLIGAPEELQRMRAASPEFIARLRAIADEEREKHIRHRAHRDLRKKPDGADVGEYYAQRTRTHLFRKKRAETLAELLEARAALGAALGADPTAAGLERLLQTGAGRQLFGRALRRAKKFSVGIAIADISVCGAVAPYNALLGGKLVSMLMASPEVTNFYKERYEQTASVIASSMAGAEVIKPPELVLLTTTSLYGISSQYNRIRVPCGEVGGAAGERISYELLGETLGYGTDQFAPDTVKLLGELGARAGNEVRGVYGGGVNPRLRKVSAGLQALGLSSDGLLRHNSCRAVYGVPLARNFRRYLLGLDDAPEFFLPQGEPRAVTREIAGWWARRWLCKRIMRDDVLERVRRQHLIHPIEHEARVRLPPAPAAAQGDLFDDDDGW